MFNGQVQRRLNRRNSIKTFKNNEMLYIIKDKEKGEKQMSKINKIIMLLLSTIVICSVFGGMEVKAQPQIEITSYPTSIRPDETIYITIEFAYGDEFQNITNLVLHYTVNNEPLFNPRLLPLNTDRPSERVAYLPTDELYLVDGYTVEILIKCNWNSSLGYGGTLEDRIAIDVNGSISTVALIAIIIVSVGITIMAIPIMARLLTYGYIYYYTRNSRNYNVRKRRSQKKKDKIN